MDTDAEGTSQGTIEKLGEVSVGDRIAVGNDRGFARYVGCIDGQSGIWIGVEWDDPSRGKHDGQVKGKRYFTARSSTGGSFLRANNVLPGEDLLHEIVSRYVDERDENDEEFGGKVVERIGMKGIHHRQSDVWRLTVVVLDYMRVARPPPESCPPFSRCRELNLHGNLLHRWHDVFEILRFFPSLREFILRNNIMENIESVEELKDLPVDAPIFHLVLNNCGITETTIRAVLSKFPYVSDLYACGNQLHSFDPGSFGSNLRLLDLENNPLRCFSAVDPHGQIERLESLSLISCQISHVNFENGIHRFQFLKSLNIKDNPIGEWASIHELQQLGELKTLFIESRFLPTELGLDVREILIAKLPSITMLNRGDVSAVERRSSELRFLNKFSSLPDDTRQIHKNDLDRLTAIHGAPIMDSCKKGMTVVKVNIEHDGNVIQRPLPLSITVSRVCSMVARLFQLDPSRVRLILDQKGVESEMELPARQLSFYSVEPEDRIRVVV